MSLHRGWSRLATLGTAAVLGASTLVLAAPSAQAADTAVITGAAMKWGVSRYLNEHLTSQSFTDGATEDETGIVTFTAGTGTVDPVAKTASVTYGGTASYGFAMGGPALYGVSFTDPTVIVGPDGAGRIEADVAWFGSAVTPGSVADTVVTTFTASATDWNRSLVRATPVWSGAVPADSYGAGKPVDGQSWAKTLVDALPAAVRATFYSSGSNPASDAKKFPAAFSAQFAALPSVTPTVTAASPANGVDVQIKGADFSPVTKAGDAGVYVGVAPADAVIDLSDRASTALFTAVDWVMPAQIVEGAFTKSLNLPAAKLVSGKSYVVYTWQAHTYSNTTQDTRTPLTIDWAKVFPIAPPAASQQTSVKATWAKKPTTIKAGKLKVVVSAATGTPTGQVKVVLTKGGKKVAVPVKALQGGQATLAVKKLKAGTWKAAVSYLGGTGYDASATTVKVKVKAKVKVKKASTKK